MPEHIPKVVLLPRENYLATIRGNIGSTGFRHLYANVDGQEQDLLKDGLVSCAYFVSTIVSMPNFKLLPSQHAGVAGMQRALEANGWVNVSEPTLPGQIIVWEKAQQAGGEPHLHAGFFMGGDKAVSHVDSARAPQEHHVTFGTNDDGTPNRKIIAVYTHQFLG